MTKARDWAKTEATRPAFILSRQYFAPKVVADVQSASDGVRPMLQLHATHLWEDEALALARWIIATFGD